MLGKNNTGKAQRSMAPLYRKFTEAEEQGQSQTLQELGSGPLFFLPRSFMTSSAS